MTQKQLAALKEFRISLKYNVISKGKTAVVERQRHIWEYGYVQLVLILKMEKDDLNRAKLVEEIVMLQKILPGADTPINPFAV